MADLLRAVTRYRRALDARRKALDSGTEAYAKACDRATAASVALGRLDTKLRTKTYTEWAAENGMS